MRSNIIFLMSLFLYAMPCFSKGAVDYFQCPKDHTQCTYSLAQLEKDVTDQFKYLNSPTSVGTAIRKIIESGQTTNKTAPVRNALTSCITPATVTYSHTPESLSAHLHLSQEILSARRYNSLMSTWAEKRIVFDRDNTHHGAVVLGNSNYALEKFLKRDSALYIDISGAQGHQITTKLAVNSPLPLTPKQKEALRIYHQKGRESARDYINEHPQEFPADQSTYQATAFVATSALIGGLCIYFSQSAPQ